MKPKKENVKTSPKNVAKLKISKDGPYIIYGGIPIQKQVIIVDSDGTATEWQQAPNIRRRKSVPFAVAGSPRISLSVTAATILRQKVWKRCIMNKEIEHYLLSPSFI